MKTREERLKLKQTRDLSYDNFRRNLRILRGSQDLSAIELSDRLGLHSGSRCIDLEYGRSGVPNVWELDTIAKYFQISIDDLLNKKAVITFQTTTP